MVMRKVVRRRRTVRKPMRKRLMRKRGVGRAAIKRTSDYAKVVEIQETQMVAVTNGNNDSVGGLISFCLQDYQRPQEVAHAYKYYRASKVEVTFIPYFNLAATGGAAGQRLPQLYYSVDRVSNRWIAPTEAECLERGISPKVFNRKHKLVFKPNLLQEISLETTQALVNGQPGGMTALGFQNATAIFNKWLPTQQSYGYNQVAGGGNAPQIGQVIAPNGVNPYALRYHGAIFVPAIDGQAPGIENAVACGDIQLKITWEFKGPRALKTNDPLVEPNPYVSTSTQGPSNAIPNTQPTQYP